LALGLPDRRLAQLPAHYAALLADTAALQIDQPDGLSTEEYQQLWALTPRFADLCTQLAAYGIPETLHHDDFHDANIFVRNGQYRLADWAESCLTHPFFTLVVGLRGIAYRFGLTADSAEVAQLRTLYLATWQEYGALPTLLAASQLAECIGTVCRALTWHKAVANLPEPLKTEHGEAVSRWLRQFLLAHAALADNFSA
jgi:aminoglycoside phosphotransferase (APT) family kinase protein